MQETATQFNKLNHAPAYKQLAMEITRLVMSGALKHGQSLPTEAALCDQFGVNRSTVREGIRLLEETGLVQRTGGKKMFVSRPSREQMGDQLERGLILHEITFMELWETAMLLEPETAALAASHLKEEELEALELNVRNTERAIAEGTSLVELDVEFHDLIAQAVHNRVLLLAREPMSRLFYPTFGEVFTHVRESKGRLLKAHKAILHALKNRAPEDASQWMEKHIRDFRRGYEAAGLDIHSAITPGSQP
jgi:GntR family transcriptional regulator, transcriptional repressor for pyruvate dehydrogenase complex